MITQLLPIQYLSLFLPLKHQCRLTQRSLCIKPTNTLLLVRSSHVLVTMSGTNLSSGLFVREISMFFPESRSTRHYVFEEGTSTILSVEDSRTNWYQTTVLGGLGVHQPTSGALPRSTIPTILNSLKRYSLQDSLCWECHEGVFGDIPRRH